jgi:hypothetical protein
MREHKEAFVCEGKSGVTVELNNGRVIIRHPRGLKGLLQDPQRGRGDKEIPISSVTAVQLKPVGWATSGYIQFAYSGSTESKGGVFNAVKDENTVMFDKKQQPRFEELKNRILEAQSAGTTTSTPTKAQEIRELSKLLEDGIISEEEFAAAKRRVLS